jgi:hypothetical protein
MNANELIPRLTSEFDYPLKGAQIVAEKLANVSPQMKEIIAKFWDTGEIPSIEVNGYTFSRLAQEHNMKPIAALLTLDWLIRDPEKAKASLKKGHDSVTRKNSGEQAA